MHHETNMQNKILIIEDDDFYKEALVEHFKTAFKGYVVLSTATFEITKLALQDHSFAVIVIDPGMPDFGSVAESDEMRLNVIEYIINASPKAIHIVITGRFNSQEAEECRLLGAKAYLGKLGLNAPALANVKDKLPTTDFFLHRGTMTPSAGKPEVHYPELTATEEQCLKWVAERPAGMKRKELFDLMAKHFHMKGPEIAEQKYKRARSKFIAIPAIPTTDG
jgi:DNA-binding NarL/FixJ family response regulator